MVKLYSVWMAIFYNMFFTPCMAQECSRPAVEYESSGSNYGVMPIYLARQSMFEDDCYERYSMGRVSYDSNIESSKTLVGSQPIYEPRFYSSATQLLNNNEQYSHTRVQNAQYSQSFLSKDVFPQYQPENNYMQELYDKAHLLLRHLFTGQKNRLDQAKSSITIANDFINACDIAKFSDINEDRMAKFAFDRPEKSVTDNCKVAFIFGLLKNYNKSILTDRGRISSALCDDLIPLFKSLNIGENMSFDVQKQFECSAAMKSLIWDICKIERLVSKKRLCDFVSLLYSGKIVNKSSNVSSIVSSSDFKKNFLYKSFFYLNDKGVGVQRDLPDIIEFVKGIKRDNERALGYHVLYYETTLEGDYGMLPFYASYASQKEKISVLCLLIEKYLKTAKLFPVASDFDYYDIIKTVSISLPDTFDGRFLDSNYVAFEEYKQLLKDVKILKDESDDIVRACVQVYYPDYPIKD